VVFSGYSALAKAMPAALNEEKGATCTGADKKWCDAQVDFMVTTTKVAKYREEAIQMAMEPGSFLEPKCKPCYAPDEPKNDTAARPFDPEAGLYQGMAFLSVGGANRNGLINAQRLEDYWGNEGLEQIIRAGFKGVAFDVESTEGEEDLVAALERAFAACKKAGLLVMVTTSHTAPYAAASEASKPMMVDSCMPTRGLNPRRRSWPSALISVRLLATCVGRGEEQRHRHLLAAALHVRPRVLARVRRDALRGGLLV